MIRSIKLTVADNLSDSSLFSEIGERPLMSPGEAQRADVIYADGRTINKSPLYLCPFPWHLPLLICSAGFGAVHPSE